MKKIKRIIIVSLTTFIFIAALFQLQGCEAIQTVINYFVDIEASEIIGTENTEFTFTANTNDIVESWIIDDQTVQKTAVRAVATDNEFNILFYFRKPYNQCIDSKWGN